MSTGVNSALILNGNIDDACKKLTNKIKGALYDIAHSFVYIGLLLYECECSQEFLDWGYSSIYEYASAELGFKKSSVNNFINICKVFSVDGRSMFLKDKYDEFNYSQLCEMLSMTDKQRALVSPDMSVRDIRNIKKADKVDSSSDVFIDDVQVSSEYNMSPVDMVHDFQTSGKYEFLSCGDMIDLVNFLDESYLSQEEYVNFGIFCSDYFEKNGYEIVKKRSIDNG